MSQKIHILPESLCNQIAAGEVVERPASVVKELVENSLDAGADRIQVEVENGGKRLIRVTDNGSGMSREDAFLCLERHATSKLRMEQDLFRLTTLGFRGEALPSIAAVSRLVLRTRLAEAMEGWEILAEAGMIKHSAAAGGAPGTSIEIRNLFFNTPARRKFLRRDETELGHIGETLTRLALSCPEVCLRFVHNGRVLWDVNRQKTLVERVAELLGREAVRSMIHMDQQAPEGLRLHGLISQPGLNRAGLGGVYTFINGRYIRDRVVQHALGDAYRNLLPRGRHPVVVLFLDIEPSQVDVNVHPTKHEVRFREQSAVHDFIVQALRSRLRGPAPPAAVLPVEGVLSRGSAGQGDEPQPAPVLTGFADASRPPAPVATGRTAGTYRERADLPAQDKPRVQEIPPRYTVAAEQRVSPAKDPPRNAAGLFDGPEGQMRVDGPGSEGFFSSLRILGQYHNSYLVCQTGMDLVLVDQHAAHERIGFEQLKQQYLCGRVERQMLLFPKVLEFDFRLSQAVKEHQDTFARLGFCLDHFGGNAYALKEIPQLLRESDIEQLVRDLAEDLAVMGRSRLVEIEMETVLIRMACHGMVRANQKLAQEEMRALLELLDQTPFNSHCPHGRPTCISWSLSDVERLFKRA